jgi:hypothetical protein
MKYIYCIGIRILFKPVEFKILGMEIATACSLFYVRKNSHCEWQISCFASGFLRTVSVVSTFSLAGFFHAFDESGWTWSNWKWINDLCCSISDANQQIRSYIPLLI